MGAGAIAASVVAIVASAGSQVNQAEEQKKAASKQKKELAEAERLKKEEADRIARETAPEGENFDSTEFGLTDGEDDRLGSVSDFLKPKGSSLGTTDTTGGLGFQI